MYVTTFFNLQEEYVDRLNDLTPKFGYDGYGEIVYYRTYSRKKPKDSIEADLPRRLWTGQEHWGDTVLRVINGTFSIRKNHYVRNHIPWDEERWQRYAFGFGRALYEMEWLPPGRGLWAMGTEFVYQRGSMALYNCAFTNLTSDNLSDDLEWLMDSLMVGCGVGWDAQRVEMKCYQPIGRYYYDIGDTREEWAKSVKLLIDAFTKPNTRLPIFRYHLIREKGLLIEGFGGLSSGPEPLVKLHGLIAKCFNRYINTNDYDIVQLKADLANMIGCCVVAGNVRRSAEIGLGWITDDVFLNLKDYEKYPDRAEHGWMSNNTVKCLEPEHFELLGEVARRVPLRGEPGIANLKNFRKGRLNGKKETRRDNALGANPCGEITLEHRETCNVDETCPTMCLNTDGTFSSEKWYRGCEYASFYASTVSLLPTHQPSTNAVVMRNRRIGVGIIDYTGWVEMEGQHKVIKHLRRGYKIVRLTNRACNGEAGVPEAIKVTTIKPGGTGPKLPGKTSGAGYSTFEYTLRRTRIAKNHPMVPLLEEAGVPMEPEVNDPQGTLVFEYPIHQSGKTAEQVTIWQQAKNIELLQREWSDNAVSNTIYFKPKWILETHVWVTEEMNSSLAGFYNAPVYIDDLKEIREDIMDGKKLVVNYYNGVPCEIKIYTYNPHHEEDVIEAVLSSIMPNVKMVSFLPHSPKGVYPQMPEEGITIDEYHERLNAIERIPWENFHGSDGEDEKYCSGASCELSLR